MNKKSRKTQEIAQAALRRFLRHGYHPVRIEDIISEARIGKGTFYLYFQSKEEVVVFLFQKLIDEIRENLLSTSAGIQSNMGIRQVFRQEALGLARIFKENKEVARLFFREGRAIGPKVDRFILEFFEELQDMTEQTLATAQAFGFIPKINSKIASCCIVGGIVEIYSSWVEGQLKGSVKIITEATLDFFEQALL